MSAARFADAGCTARGNMPSRRSKAGATPRLLTQRQIFLEHARPVDDMRAVRLGGVERTGFDLGDRSIPEVNAPFASIGSVGYLRTPWQSPWCRMRGRKVRLLSRN
jgi:hypothetical protein